MRDLFIGAARLLAEPRCLGCEEPSLDTFCGVCSDALEPAPTRNAIYGYGGPIAEAIHRYKYQGRSELAVQLGALLAGGARSLRGSADAVVPVPLHWRRRRARGFDQAALLALPVGRALGVPTRLRGLKRVRHTPRQVELSRAERLTNVLGAFEAWRLGPAERVLLVDDVTTTGATLAAASNALRSAGVREVLTLVLATRVLA